MHFEFGSCRNSVCHNQISFMWTHFLALFMPISAWPRWIMMEAAVEAIMLFCFIIFSFDCLKKQKKETKKFNLLKGLKKKRKWEHQIKENFWSCLVFFLNTSF